MAPGHRVPAVAAWNDVVAIADGPVHSSQSQIAFPSREQLSLLIEAAGLEVERRMGDWSAAPRSHKQPRSFRLIDSMSEAIR